MEPQQSSSKTIAIIATLLVIVGAVFMFVFNTRQAVSANTQEQTTPTTEPTQPIPPTPIPTTSGTYKNGTYTAAGSYKSPAGSEEVSVTLTVQNDMISAVSVSGGSPNETSQRFIKALTSGVDAAIVGKNISEVQPTVISGASLTSKGFYTAVEAIKAQARS
jgi:uncharacterized protein with FMN-binding domain